MDPIARRSMRFEQVKRFLASDMTVSQWCSLNGVGESTLYAWMSRYRGSELEDDLSAVQKRKGTASWIELSRSELASEVALAIANEPGVLPGRRGEDSLPVAHRDAPVQRHTGVVQPPLIAAAINGVVISVPTGCAVSDIAAVLKAASML